MRRFAYHLPFVVLLCMMFWPWALGLVDAAAWGVAGQQITSIPWDGARGHLQLVWPIGWMGALLLCLALLA